MTAPAEHRQEQRSDRPPLTHLFCYTCNGLPNNATGDLVRGRPGLCGTPIALGEPRFGQEDCAVCIDLDRTHPRH